MDKPSFDFDAPNKVDLLNDTDDMDVDSYFSTNRSLPVTNTNVKVVSPLPKVQSPVVRKATPYVKKQTPATKIEDSPQTIRQSPRLAENKVPVSSIEKPKRSHRRSISEGKNFAPRLNKISKNNCNASSKPALASMKKMTDKTGGFSDEDQTSLNKIATMKEGFSKPLKTTKTKEFNFSTDARIKSRKRSVSSDTSIKDFARTLRSCSNKSNNQSSNQLGPTKVKAFNLHESKPRSTAEPFVSNAELDMKYWKKTPQRFRSKPQNLDQEKKCKMDSGVTIPHTPNLTCRMRARSIHDIPTREQMEQKEFEEARKNKFKALPLNKKIFDAPPQMVETKVVTIPEPFDITDFKKESRRQILRVAGICGDVSMASIPFRGVPTLLTPTKSTLPKPFSFHSRDNQTLKKKQHNILKVIEEEKKLADFQAQPMPVFDGVQGLPKKKTLQKTKLMPFNIRTDSRGATKQQQFKQELEELEKQDSEQRKFKAQSDEILFKQPFIPEKSKKTLTDISTFTLNTEKRHDERHNYEIHLKEKEDEIMAKKREREERQRLDDEAEVHQMRKDAVHKAQPVKKYSAVEIKHGLLAPTVPISPDFATNSRLKSRAASRQDLSVLSGDKTFTS